MAAPHVAGAAALVWSVNPGLTYSEVKAFLLLSTDKLSSLQGLCVTGGRLNLYTVLNMTRKGEVRNTKGTPNPGDDTFHVTIQDAINNANDGDELIVQKGRWYFENVAINKKLVVRSGNVNDPFDPTISASDTFISGLLGSGFDAVVSIIGPTGSEPHLAGFTIRDGFWGGVLLHADSPTISDCIITYNTRGDGGGIACYGGDPNIKNCTISYNSATPLFDEPGGGGIYCAADSEPNIINCTISGNSAEYSGGGIYCVPGSNATITGCTITSNIAALDGGGIYLDDCTATISDCTISSNNATGSFSYGGGVYCDSASPEISNCEISNNWSSFEGGGIFCDNGSEANIINNIISNNIAQDDGGAIACFSSSPLIKNCLIIDNSVVSWDGGAIYLGDSSPEISNCTISGNRASDAAGLGGGLFCYLSSKPDVTNCIFSDNEHYAIAVYEDIDDDQSNPNLTYSLFFNNSDGDYVVYDDSTTPPGVSVYTGANAINNDLPLEQNKTASDNLDGDPMFVRGRLGNFYLSQYAAGQLLDVNGDPVDPNVNPEDANSPAVDTGSDTATNLGMNIYSTRTDAVVDSGYVDIGYHYTDLTMDPNVFLSTSVIGNGSITPAGITEHKPYAQVFIVATADPDSEFVSWSGTDDNTRIEIDPNGYPSKIQHNVVTLDTNKTVTAVFESKMVLLRTRVLPGVHGETGTIQPRKAKRYRRGTVVNLHAEPDNPAYAIIWNGTDDDYSTLKYNTITMLEDPEIVEVEFYEPVTHFVGDDWSTIQLAIEAAHDRDIIQIAPGTYTMWQSNEWAGYWLPLDKAITIRSANPDNPSSVVLEGAFSMSNVGRNTVLLGLTFDHTDWNWFGGPGDDGLTEDNPDTDGMNGASVGGGALVLGYSIGVWQDFPPPYLGPASPTVINCVFVGIDLTGGNGGAGANGDGISGDPAGDGGWAGRATGGAVLAGPDCKPLFKNCQFIDCFVRGGDGGNGAPDPSGQGGNWGDPDSPDWFWGPYVSVAWYSGYGGAVYCQNGSAPEFVDCEFIDNAAYGGSCGINGAFMDPSEHFRIDRFGGAVYAEAGSSPTFKGCSFTDNLTPNLIGSYGWPQEWNPGDDVGQGEPTAVVDPYIGYGGAVAFEDGATPFFEDCTFNGNQADIGGAIWENWAYPQIDGCSFLDNSALHGGGVLLAGGTAKIARSDFSGNEASGSAAQGGAICSLGANAMIVDCDISDNDTTGSGGGIYISSKDIDGSVVLGDNSMLVKNCLVTDNTSGRDGAGISANWYSDPNISNCTIANNIVTGDGFAHGYGGGLYCSYGNYTNIIDSIIWGNSAEIGEQIAIGTSPRPSTVSVSYSDVEDGAAGVYVDTGDPGPADDSILIWDVDPLDPDYPTNLTGLGVANPLFASLSNWGDHFLGQPDTGDANQTILSPCVDAGSDYAFSLDMYRHTTRTDRIPEDLNSVVDMGYHYILTADILGDFNFDGIVNIIDFEIFMLHWLEEGCEFPDWCHGTDLNQDGVVDNFDLAKFGKNYGEVEKTPPEPNPMTWEALPHSTGPSSVGMTATRAVDNSGFPVEYHFDCVDGDCGDPCNPVGIWIGEFTSMISNGINGIIERWEVRDDWTTGGYWKLMLPLPGGIIIYSENASGTYTYSNGHYVANCTGTATETQFWTSSDYSLTLDLTGSITDAKWTAIGTYVIDFSEAHWQDDNGTCRVSGYVLGPFDSGWQTSRTYQATGLTSGFVYGFRVKARDVKTNPNNNAETDWSVTGYAIPGQDNTPPSPDPMTWATDPYATSTTSIRMIATTATDPSGVEYYFEETSGNPGGGDSGWQDSPIYEDTGLAADTTYTYRVMARDKSVNQNATAWSIELSATTSDVPPPVDTEPPLPNPSQWAATATLWPGTGFPQQYFSGVTQSYWHRMEAVTAADATPPVEYYFDCYQGNGLSSGWQASPIYDYQVGAPMICKYRVRTRDSAIPPNVGDWSQVWPTQ
jgi:parallel beta-helix repeat protein